MFKNAQKRGKSFGQSIPWAKFLFDGCVSLEVE